MTFPDTPLGVHVELAFGADPDDPGSWEWTDVSGWSFDDGWSQPAPASTSVVLDNRDGLLTPGKLGGLGLGRGTPMRVWVHDGPSYLRGTASSTTASIPFSPLWVAAEVGPTAEMLIARPGSFSAWLSDNRRKMTFEWQAGGATRTATGSVSSTEVEASGVVAYGALHNPSTGRVEFYVAPSLEGPWTFTDADSEPFGAINDTGSTLVVGGDGDLYHAEIRRFGITGPLVASMDVTDVAPGSSSFVSGGRTWTVGGAVVAEHVRFVGFVDEIHPSWPHGDLSEEAGVYLPWYTADYPSVRVGGESVITITASSVLRRLGQGSKPIRSPLARYWPRRLAGFGGPAWYQSWPLENAGRYAEPAYGNEPAGTFTGGWESTDTLPGSEPLPWLPDRDTRGGFVIRPNVRDTNQWTAIVSVYIPEPQPDGAAVELFSTSDRTFEAPFALAVPPGYPPFDTVRLTASALTSNTPPLVVVSVLQAGNVVASGLVAGTFWGRWVNVYVSCSFSGATGTQLTVGWYSLNMLEHQSWTYNFLTTMPSGPHLRVIRRPSARGAEGGIGFGHVVALTSELPVAWVDHANRQNPYLAHPGERASTRLRRLALDAGVPLALLGAPSSSVQLGPEPAGTFLDVARDAAEADLGILADDIDGPGLIYRSHTSLYEQTPHTFDAGQSEIANPFAPVLDDQRLRNDVTAKNDDASAHDLDVASIAVEGHYDAEIDVNVPTWALPHQASWRLRMGAWPGLRYPTVTVDMLAAHTEPAEMIRRWLRVRLGDRIQITNLPPQHPGDVDLIVEGWTETLSPFGWTVEANCSPGGPWQVGVLGESRLDTLDSTLTAPVGDLDSTLSVSGDWDDTDLPYDVVVGGERMTITAISGSTFTVERDWGRTIAHPAGTSVRVADPFVVALGGAPS